LFEEDIFGIELGGQGNCNTRNKEECQKEFVHGNGVYNGQLINRFAESITEVTKYYELFFC